MATSSLVTLTLGRGSRLRRSAESAPASRAVPSAGRDVERRVAVEQPERLEPERDRVDGHHRPVFRAGDVMDSEYVPEHHVGVLDGPVLRGPPGQSRVPLAEAREVAARPALLRPGRRGPAGGAEPPGPPEHRRG